MGTKIKIWEIENNELIPSESTMIETGRKEVDDLEKWIKANPSILGEDILIIGEQVQTKKGPLDFLGIDSAGNIIIIELKRDKLPREALAQAIDYASDISSWDVEELDRECLKYTEQTLEEYLKENFGDDEDRSINQFQKILLVGTGTEESLERMVEWLSDSYGMSVNVIILKYTKTKTGSEILARTMIISEELEKEKSQKHQRKIYAERHVLRKEFWTQLLEKVNQKTDLFSNISPNIYSWIGRGAGKSGISYNFVISNRFARCEIYLDAGKESKEINKKRFDQLLSHKEEIENKFGNPLNWEKLETKRASRISYEFKEVSLRNKEEWPEVQDKLITTMIKLVDSTKSYILGLE